ncbi:MAG: phage portal protein [Thermodesulfobacteriota bacterium]
MWNGQYYQPPARLSAAWSSIKPEYSDAIAILEGRHLALLQADISARFNANNAALYLKQPLMFNVAGRVVGKLAMLYKTFPKFEGSNTKMVEQLTPRLGGSLKQADRLSEICGVAWVGLEWDAERKELRLIVVPPDQFEPQWSPDGTTLIAANIYTVAEVSDGGRVRPVTLRTEWTPTSYRVFEENKDRTDFWAPQWAGFGGYGLVPFAPMRPNVPLLGEPHGKPRESLIHAQRTLNIKLTELMALMSLQGGGQPVMKGGQPPKDIALGQGNVIFLETGLSGDNPDFFFAAPSANISGCWETIEKLIQYVAFLHFLSGQWSASGTAPSGEALKVNNADLEEYRADKEDSHRMFWRDFGEIAATVLSYHNVGTGRGDDLVVNYTYPPVYENPNEVAARWEVEIKNLVRSRAEWARSLHPEVEEEEDPDAAAQAIVDANAAAEKGIRAASNPAPAGADAFTSAALNGGGAGAENAEA